MTSKKTGLGQGVGLLFPDEEEGGKYYECDLDQIILNQDQPRNYFEEEGLEELAQSIREHGVIQPLVVTTPVDGAYQLIAGERRWRASKMAGLKKVPIVVRTSNKDESLLELALIENIQRHDLNVIEEAEAYNKLIERFHYTQEQTAQRVGKKRSTITNILRLLQLPDFIKKDLEQKRLTEGHARVLLKLIDDDQSLQQVRDQIIEKNLSVRQTEALVRRVRNQSPKTVPDRRNDQEVPAQYYTTLANRMTNRLQSKVSLSRNGARGKIEIEYYSLDDLERVTTLILGET